MHVDPMIATNVCHPIGEIICGDQGTIVNAVSYLDTHYQINPTSCNQSVIVPWVWNARFAAELTYQAASFTLNREFEHTNSHKFSVLHDRWCEQFSDEQIDEEELKRISKLSEDIDKSDPKGTGFRYTMSIEGSDSISPTLDEHCKWPLVFRQIVASVCDYTIVRLPDESESCKKALRFLRATAAAGECLGDFFPDIDQEWLSGYLDQKVDSFTESKIWRQYDDLGIQREGYLYWGPFDEMNEEVKCIGTVEEGHRLVAMTETTVLSGDH